MAEFWRLSLSLLGRLAFFADFGLRRLLRSSRCLLEAFGGFLGCFFAFLAFDFFALAIVVLCYRQSHDEPALALLKRGPSRSCQQIRPRSARRPVECSIVCTTGLTFHRHLPLSLSHHATDVAGGDDVRLRRCDVSDLPFAQCFAMSAGGCCTLPPNATQTLGTSSPRIHF